MLRTVKKTALALAALGFTAALVATWTVVSVVEGLRMPATLYTIFPNQSAPLPLLHERRLDLLLQPRPEAAVMRDLAFDLFNINPQARANLRTLPLAYSDGNGLAGSFDPNTGRVTIGRHSPYTFLHEFAHANFQRKPLAEKTGFLLATWQLWNHSDGRYAQAREVLGQELATAQAYAQRGEPYNPILELYAHLAEVAEGDLSAIPEPLQPYYADYLQPGPNQWMRYRATLGS